MDLYTKLVSGFLFPLHEKLKNIIPYKFGGTWNKANGLALMN